MRNNNSARNSLARFLWSHLRNRNVCFLIVCASYVFFSHNSFVYFILCFFHSFFAVVILIIITSDINKMHKQHKSINKRKNNKTKLN